MFINKYISYALIAVSLTAFSGYKYIQNNNLSTKMVAIDGDTFKFSNRYYRLLGIDSPEKGNTCYFEAREALQKVLDKGVKMKYYNKDKYGRQLVVLQSDDYTVDYNKYLIQNTGYYTARYHHKYDYVKYARLARCVYYK